MALSTAKTSALAVDRDQRDEDQVRFDHRSAALGLHDPEGAGRERVARAELERLGGVVERRERDDPSDRARFLHRRRRADLRAQGRIAADYHRIGAERGQMLGEALLEPEPLGVAQGAGIGLARVERGPAKRFLRKRLRLRPRVHRRPAGRKGR